MAGVHSKLERCSSALDVALLSQQISELNARPSVPHLRVRSRLPVDTLHAQLLGLRSLEHPVLGLRSSEHPDSGFRRRLEIHS